MRGLPAYGVQRRANSLGVLRQGTVSGGAASPLLDGLIAYWKLDEASGTRIDSAGSNNLADNGSVGSATGIQGNAAQFDGSNYLSLASNPDVQMNGDYTIACWVYLGVLDGSNQMIASKDVLGGREYTLTVSADFRFSIPGGGTVIEKTSPSTNTWYFLVAEYRSSDNRIRLILNDDTPNVVTISSAVTPGNAEFQVGAREFSGAEGFISNGSRIDELGIWKRILTAAEITQLHNSGAATTYPF
jgi:hypothetical protein